MVGASNLNDPTTIWQVLTIDVTFSGSTPSEDSGSLSGDESYSLECIMGIKGTKQIDEHIARNFEEQNQMGICRWNKNGQESREVFLSLFFSYREHEDKRLVLLTNELTGQHASVDREGFQAGLRQLQSRHDKAGECVEIETLRQLRLLFDSEKSCREHYAAYMAYGVPEHPRVEQVELTNFCPCSCWMCPRPTKMKRTIGHMDIGIFRRICQQIAPHQKFLSLHHFGESLLYPKLPEAVAIATDFGIHTGLSCNAPFLRPEMSKRLQESGLSSISFNLDSFDTELYQKIRGVDFTVEENLRAIRRFVDSNCAGHRTLVSVQMIQMKCNEHEAGRFLSTAKDLGVDRATVVKFGQWDFADEEAAGMANLGSRALYSGTCPMRWDSVCILWDGTVVPCCRDYDGELVMGNLSQEPLWRLWTSEVYDQLRSDEGRFARCRRCWASWPYRIKARQKFGLGAFHRRQLETGRRLEWLTNDASSRYEKIGFPVAFRVARERTRK